MKATSIENGSVSVSNGKTWNIANNAWSGASSDTLKQALKLVPKGATIGPTYISKDLILVLVTEPIPMLYRIKGKKVTALDLKIKKVFGLDVVGTNAVLIAPQHLLLVNVAKMVVDKTIFLHFNASAVALHPSKPMVSVGEVNGRIHQLSLTNDSKTMMHWHAYQVNCLTFSSDGTLLFSGGDEGVLVIWELESASKQFLPRLGAPIDDIRVSEDMLHYAVSLRDNSILIVSAVDMTIVSRIQGLISGANRQLTSLGHQKMVVYGQNQNIQFFDMALDQGISSIDVSLRNAPARNDEAVVPTTSVHSLKFSLDQAKEWMFTIDRQDYNEHLNKPTSLKIWQKSTEYRLHSRFDSVFNGNAIGIDVGMDASGPILMTADAFQIKIMTCQTATTEQKEQVTQWICQKTLVSDYPLTCASLSLDGSAVIACGSEDVRVFDIKTLECLFKLSLPKKGLVQSTLFADSEHLLLVFEDFISVWNLLSNQESWRMDLSIQSCTVHSSKPKFAVTSQSSLFVFQACSPIPILVQDCQNVESMTFTDHKTELIVLQDGVLVRKASSQPKESLTVVEEQAFESVFTRVFGKTLNPSGEFEETGNDLYRKANITSFKDVPSHLFQTTWQLCERFMEQQLS